MVPFSTDYLATLKSRNAPTLQPVVEGDVTRIFVNSGQRVERGAPILEIDQRGSVARVPSKRGKENAPGWRGRFSLDCFVTYFFLLLVVLTLSLWISLDN